MVPEGVSVAQQGVARSILKEACLEVSPIFPGNLRVEEAAWNEDTQLTHFSLELPIFVGLSGVTHHFGNTVFCTNSFPKHSFLKLARGQERRQHACF